MTSVAICRALPTPQNAHTSKRDGLLSSSALRDGSDTGRRTQRVDVVIETGEVTRHAPLTDRFVQQVIDAIIAAASSGRIAEVGDGERRP
jgi:hypothetical protein